MVATLLPSATDVNRQLFGSLAKAWHCQTCGNVTPPLVGKLVSSCRHTCDACGRKVCDSCSFLPLGSVKRTCGSCYLGRCDTLSPKRPQKEKYIFLVRHAESTWNVSVDLVKGCSTCLRSLAKGARSSPSSDLDSNSITGCTVNAVPGRSVGEKYHGKSGTPGGSVKDFVSRGLNLVAHDVWNRDHPISQEGNRQAEVLRNKVWAMKNEQYEQEDDRQRRFYDSFLKRRHQIYCSPLLRALQTAQLALPEDHGWGSITLLKDARERFRFVFERDCLGTDVGDRIWDRATEYLQEDVATPHRNRRVDATDCSQQWWSEEPETEEQVDARLQSLWKRLLDDDASDSCVLVTHSNLIKALVMKYGGLGFEPEPGSEWSPPSGDTDGNDGRRVRGLSDVDVEHSDLLDGDSDNECAAAWQVVNDGPEALRRMKVERLQNCGVLGLRCVLEEQQQDAEDPDSGWVDAGGEDDDSKLFGTRCGGTHWVAKDALLMFDSLLVQ